MLSLISAAIEKAPVCDETDMVGFPINAILNWTMGVPAGFAAFRNEKVNAIFRKILDEYAAYLDSPASLSVINDSPAGWKSQAALAKLEMEQYPYVPGDTHWGYRSWNDFFTRRLKRGVNKRDAFWIKAQPYSLSDMPGNDDAAAAQFVGGDVYQAFLSALKYHRWHSPVAGTIKKAYIQRGVGLFSVWRVHVLPHLQAWCHQAFRGHERHRRQDGRGHCRGAVVIVPGRHNHRIPGDR